MIKDKYDFSEIENQIKQDIKLNKIPSVAMAVAKDGKIIYEKTFGYADIENKIESTIETSYQLASVTKTMTATAIMILDKKTDFNKKRNYIFFIIFQEYGKARRIFLQSFFKRRPTSCNSCYKIQGFRLVH